MRKQFKYLLILLVLSIIRNSLFVIPVKAVCPVCTIAIGAGLGLSRYLGVDDVISGLWIGAIILSSSFWFIGWLEKKIQSKPKLAQRSFSEVWFRRLNLIIIILMYLLVLVPLSLTGVLGHPFNKILGIDKLIFGTAVGSGVFLLALWADKKVRQIKGKQLFSYQKVVFPLSALAICSLITYFILK
jgi:hypothetical protein